MGPRSARARAAATAWARRVCLVPRSAQFARGGRFRALTTPTPRISVTLQAFCGPGGGIGVENTVTQEEGRERRPGVDGTRF